MSSSLTLVPREVKGLSGGQELLSMRCVCVDRASVLQVVLSDALGGQFSHHVVQIVGVGVAVAREVGAELRLVVNLVPHDRVRLSRGAGRPDGEDQTTVPRHD